MRSKNHSIYTTKQDLSIHQNIPQITFQSISHRNNSVGTDAASPGLMSPKDELLQSKEVIFDPQLQKRQRNRLRDHTTIQITA